MLSHHNELGQASGTLSQEILEPIEPSGALPHEIGAVVDEGLDGQTEHATDHLVFLEPTPGFGSQFSNVVYISKALPYSAG